MMVALRQVFLISPIGLDRENIAMSTVIASTEFHIEADYHAGGISDVTVFRNANMHRKDDKGVQLKAAWKWYGGIPVSNVKAYVLESPLHEPQAPTAKAPEAGK